MKLDAPRAGPSDGGNHIAGPKAQAPQAGPGVIILLVGPAVFIYVAFTLYPVLRTFWNSLHTVRAGGVTEWAGLGNFTQLLAHDPFFWNAVGNTMIFTVVSTVLDVAGGLLLALCLFAKIPFHRLFRVVWFTPVLLSYVVVGIIWAWLFDYDWGAINIILRFLGLDAMTKSWLGDPRWALWAVMAAHVWKWLGFNMIVFLAALYALPAEVLGAAELDNCGWFTKTIHIIIPMLMPTIVNLTVLSFIGKMMVFDLIWIMTQGGPLWSTETVSTYVYKRAFDWNTFALGYPSAIAVVWCVMILAFVVLISRLLRRSRQLEF
jgi:raffinose/stachyose/melibiose transport system permease protein